MEMIKNLKNIKYWIFDVDGTMTDGTIYYDNNKNETKKFNTKDAAGFFAAHACGMKIIVITGRECEATKRRMQELKVDYLFENIKNKHDFIYNLMEEMEIKESELGYIGDDLNDYSAMQLAGFTACPSDAIEEIKAIVDYISKEKGGYGVIRDVIKYVLESSNQWEKAISEVYNINI